MKKKHKKLNSAKTPQAESVDFGNEIEKANNKNNAVVEFFKSIKWAIIPFIILVVVQQFSWEIPMWIGKDGVQLTIPLDNAIPLISEFIYIYLLTFPIVIFAVLWVASKDKKHFWNIWLTEIISSIISMIIYLTFQTQEIKPDLNPVTLSEVLMMWTWGACKPINCFPSQHAMIALVTILCFYNQQKTTPLWLRILAYVCGILIMMATVFLKQHFFVDIIGSIIIMLITYIIVKVWDFGGYMIKRNNKKQEKNQIE